MLSQARRSWEAETVSSSSPTRVRRSWEAATEKPSEAGERAAKGIGCVEDVRTSGELSWIADPVPSKLGTNKQRPASPPSPQYKPKPAAEAHWTTAFGSATDWSMPGGLESPGNKNTSTSRAPAAEDFLDALDIDLGCPMSARGHEPDSLPTAHAAPIDK